MLNPKDARHYAMAVGQRGKTDRVDAELIARMIAHEHTKLHAWTPPTPEQREMARLLKRRAKLTSLRQALGMSLKGLDGFPQVPDPWNTLEHRRPRDSTLTEYVSEQLSCIINFTRTHYVHFWLVAHPKKPEKDRLGKPPTPYEIADSAHFYNKADSIITVHRNQIEESRDVLAPIEY